MDCGWQNPEQGANTHSESHKSLASSPGCIWPADPPQTNGTQDVPSPFAMMIALQLRSDVLP